MGCYKQQRRTRPPALRKIRGKVVILFTGFASLIWFLIRVIPKPSRASYPCQRAAAPLASGFVLWLVAVLGSSFSYNKWKHFLRRSKHRKAFICLLLTVVGCVAVVITAPKMQALAVDPPAPHDPVGEGKGIYPGRVVWVHAPEATDWEGYESTNHWWESDHTDLAVVEEMMTQALRNLTGESRDRDAWDAVFRYFNNTHGKGSIPYDSGEKIMIKINLTTCNARMPEVDPVTYNKKSSIMNRIDNSPQMLLILLRQLVYIAGVAQEDITIGDPTGLFPNFMWNMLHPEFPNVHYLDNYGGSGRQRAAFSDVPFFWSTSATNGTIQDYVPLSFAEADYLINFAVLKGHSCGITACGKNHYGSLIRCPDGFVRDTGFTNYYNIHQDLPDGNQNPGMGKYRAHVDLMGHPELGGKTLLYLIDGLFGGYFWEAHPYKWETDPFGTPEDPDWPSSLLASLDPIAIDSVAYDLLLNEWPDVVTGGTGAPGSLLGGAEDYLHEAAEADNPPSGTFYDPDGDGTAMESLGVHEHWNNPTNRQYSRNLGLNEGIELIKLDIVRPLPALELNTAPPHPIITWQGSLPEYQLQCTDNLTDANSWTTLTNVPTLFRGRMTVTNTTAGAMQFYRTVQ